ncbi:MAG TPA: hypothetical protein PK619_00180 [bacterium]|nr:hypothetical protein [bacterium]
MAILYFIASMLEFFSPLMRRRQCLSLAEVGFPAKGWRLKAAIGQK